MSVAASVPVRAATMSVTMRTASSSSTDRRCAMTVLVQSRSHWEAASPGCSTICAAMPANTCSSDTRMGSSAGRARSSSRWTSNSDRQALMSASSLLPK